MRLLLTLFFVAIASMAQALPDYAKESRWVDQVEDELMDGDAVFLQANNHEFMSIYTSSESNTKRTAVIVHGLGAHPNWQQVIQVLRVSLTTQGFNTFSIQMPVLGNDADSHAYMPLLDDADQRIYSAVDYLITEGLQPDLLVSHSLGSVMSTHYLANNSHPFKRFIGVGMLDMSAKYLSSINIPVLDLYGDQDIKSVLSSVDARAKSASHNNQYFQKKVRADHFFNEKNELLIDTVNAWLN